MTVKTCVPRWRCTACQTEFDDGMCPKCPPEWCTIIEPTDGFAVPECMRCDCGADKAFDRLYDARGIYCCRYCDACESAKRAEFRADVLTDPNYWHDEPIDDD